MNKTVKRRSAILSELDNKGEVNVKELSELLEVSEVTIRNDLDHLEKSNLLIRAHGGAFKTNNIALSVAEKRNINIEAKRRIGKAAVSLIKDEDSIILDSGSTTLEISNHLGSFNRLTVVSNALNIINNISQYQKVKVLTPGGTLNELSMSFVGPMAERNLRQLYCNKLFLGVDGINPSLGVFTHLIEEASLNQIMIDIAAEIIVVADSSKFKRAGHALICGLDKVDKLITDDQIEDRYKELLVKNNVELIIV